MMFAGLRTFCGLLLSALLISGFPSTPSTRAQAPGGWEGFAVKREEKEELFTPSRLLVKFREGVTPERAQEVIDAHGARSADVLSRLNIHVLQVPEGAEKAMMKAFGARPEVAFAELDSILSPEDVTPNDTYYGSQWHLPKIKAPAAWGTTTGTGVVTIAVLDTGVDGTHPDLAGKMVPGWNFYDNNGDTSDVYGHGTAVAGTAAAASNNSNGVASPAWGCQIMPVRISDPNGNGLLSTITNGLTWAADQGARVANISYRVSTYQTVTDAANYFQSKGGVVTVSAGNQATFDSAADNPYVLTVSASDSNDALASFSNTGNLIDLAAPGVNIYTTSRGGGYGSWSGTSFSAPVVAGVAALVMSVNPGLGGAQVRDILKRSADDLGAAGWDTTYGSGRVNAANAVALATGGTVTAAADTMPPSVSIASPASGAVVSGTATVQVSAGDNVGVSAVSLSVDGVAVGTDTAAPYTFSWNTKNSPNSTHTLRATATDASGNTAACAVSVTVNNVVDTTPPVVSITSPANGAAVVGNVTVAVSAQDGTGVSRVELYVDGILVGSSSAQPFTINWNSRKVKDGPHTLQAKAYDSAGNTGSSQTVTVYK